MAFLNKGLKIVFNDMRPEEPILQEFCYEGGLTSFVEFLNKNKEALHKKPIYIEGGTDVPVEIAIQYTTAYSENSYSFNILLPPVPNVRARNLNDFGPNVRAHPTLSEHLL